MEINNIVVILCGSLQDRPMRRGYGVSSSQSGGVPGPSGTATQTR
jgi:hypothetical protein